MPRVQRDEMDRGPANQELINSRMLWNTKATLIFETKEAIATFLDWWQNTIGVIGWFEMPHPRTGQTIRARVPSGAVGDISPLASGFYAATVATTLEYYL